MLWEVPSNPTANSSPTQRYHPPSSSEEGALFNEMSLLVRMQSTSERGFTVPPLINSFHQNKLNNLEACWSVVCNQENYASAKAAKRANI